MIDWDKPLECEHGEVRFVENWGEWNDVACDDVIWPVHKDTGEPISEWMPSVKNKALEDK